VYAYRSVLDKRQFILLKQSKIDAWDDPTDLNVVLKPLAGEFAVYELAQDLHGKYHAITLAGTRLAWQAACQEYERK
jgi:hypothetical protein